MNHTGGIHIGTSGWSYKHWKGPFYPLEPSSSHWMEYYTTQLKAVEINNSFYRLPSGDVFRTWYERTPENFVFSVKASRYITHIKRLNEPKDALKTLFERSQNLREKLGVILFQLPPQLKFDFDRLANFLKNLSGDFKYAVEFRHDSWWNNRTYEALDRSGVAFCIFELGGQRSPNHVTGDLIYIRLHGPGNKYQGQYSDAVLNQWANMISTWSKRRDAVFIFFDNDQNGYAAQDAIRLRQLLSL